jgi:tetratricopeptide (TPR) repeat protein
MTKKYTREYKVIVAGATTKRVSIFASLLGALAVLLSLPVLSHAHGPLHEQIIEVTRQIAIFPDSVELYLKRGELHRHHLDWPAALADFNRADSLRPDLVSIDLYCGKTWLDAAEPERAKLALNRYLKKTPDDADGLLTRARALNLLGEHLSAAQDFTRALAQLDTPQPEHYLERAQALCAGQHLAEALSGLDEGMQRLGTIVTLELFAIELEIQQQNYEAALTRLEKVEAQSPRKEKWLVRRGEILQLAGRHDEAQQAFRLALREIESLPQARRHTKATMELEKRLRAML